ncbi:MAG TPA: sialate O-acetylesterase [Tepidisphaeraceae bacterium]|nr:sialate O-acetylesterase [Tepidisphaeraceae bacterium]
MIRPLVARSAVAVLVLLLLAPPARAAIALPPMFGDHMVLQRGMEVPVWGKAEPGEKVTIEYAGQTAAATADEQGEWRAKLPKLPDGDASSFTVRGDKSAEVVLRDVIVGDVWVCSGQSNMQWKLRQSHDAEKEIAEAKYPNIRLFRVPNATSTRPTRELKGAPAWEVCTPETASEFSAVGYFFGRHVHRAHQVPVGLIQNAWGGMPAESFTSEEGLKSDPDFAVLLERKAAAGGGDGGDAELRRRINMDRQKYEKALADWQAKHLGADGPDTGVAQGWLNPGHDEKEWKTMALPKPWESEPEMDINGVVWFRRAVEIPAAWQGKPLVLSLGAIDDYDTTYVNGKQVGQTRGEGAFEVQRQYDVPAERVSGGKAVIAVRAFDTAGEGGLVGPEAAMKLAVKGDASHQPIALAGEWKYRVEKRYDAATIPPPAAPPKADAPYLPTNIYNAMVHPLLPYGIKGAIWYQGESNAARAEQYRKLFPAMIADWRKQWGQGDFPFLFVQLANFGRNNEQPGDSHWSELREAQTMTLAKSPNTAMAVTIDIGERGDIHPKNKQDVGKRLGLAADKLVYAKAGVAHSGPMYNSMKIEGDRIRLRFTHAEGLKFKDGKARGFAIAGEDQKYRWADATIEGDEVIVRADAVKNPVAVRYAWDDDPQVSLYNAADLPASPFRTDDWKMKTAGAK